jgi:hypothetical protein
MSDKFRPVKQRIIKNWRRDPHAIDKYQFLYFFVPHPQKKRRAELLSNKALVIYAILVLMLVGIFRLIPLIMPGILGYASNINVNDLLKYSNNKRGEFGASELVLNEKLSNAAKKKAEDMFANDYWAHVSPSGVEPWDFILSQGYDYIYAGENLAKNFSTSKEVVEAWYKSPSHRDNLLNRNYDEIGFAVVNGTLDGYETTLVVQVFGRPRDRSLVVSKEDEQKYLRQVSEQAVSDFVELEEPVPVSGGIPATEISRREVLPFIDVSTATHSISILFALFLVSLLSLDIWYSRTKGVTKFTGHTFLHLSFLIVVILSIWFVLTPGSIL